MNKYLQRVFAAYALAVLAAFLYSPWKTSGGDGGARYAFVWDPPFSLDRAFVPDYGRLALEVATLTLVLLWAIVSLWGEEA